MALRTEAREKWPWNMGWNSFNMVEMSDPLMERKEDHNQVGCALL